MLIRLTARVVLILSFVSPAAFCQDSATASPPQPSPPVPEGQAIFGQRCARCHGQNGEGVNAVITFGGPDIQAEHNHGDVMMAMEVGPSHMPQFAWVLSVDQMRSVADYVTQKLAVIPLTGGNISTGGKVFREYCAPCHRTAVRGGALAFAGTNAPDLSQMSATLIAGAIRQGPGPMPSFPSSVINDQQLASVVDYVQFVQHPPSPGGSSLNWYGPVAEGFAAWIVVFGLIALTGWIEKGGKG